MSVHSDRQSIFFGGNETFVAELYSRYLEKPDSVDVSWRELFDALGDNERALLSDINGPSWGRGRTGVIGQTSAEEQAAAKQKQQNSGGDDAAREAAQKSVRALMMIRAYRAMGHFQANLDPLKLKDRGEHEELDYRNFGFTPEDLDAPIYIDTLGLEQPTLREIIRRLEETYCGNIGVEYSHILDPDQRLWIQERIESIHNRTEFTDLGRRAILERLTAAECFEKFLDKKYTGTKRFGLDGGEALVPALEQIIKRGGQLGVREIVIGMPHRGRLNVLANMMGKPYQAIFSEFQGNAANPEDVQGSGDVKYHLGTSSDREFDGNSVHMSLTANPSHLEAVNPVVLGKVRAKQMQRGAGHEHEVVGVLMHGDAAFAGQGIVAESLDLTALKGYRTGGTLHVIVNNQIGFTTSPAYSRSGPYCSEMAKIIGAPIFHVNGDDPEAVVHVARIAMEYRQEFANDVVIDMFCYRRHGHNEGDEPAFTQPLMYKKIATHPTTRQLYAADLEKRGLVEVGEPDRILDEFFDRLESDFKAASSYKPNKADWLEGAWSGLDASGSEYVRGDTAVALDKLRTIGEKLTNLPDGFNVNRKIVRFLKNRRTAIDSGKGIDWATAEALAFGTLLDEGTMVRLSGQDSGRGTFSQRHAVLVDQESEDRYLPLQNLADKQAMFEVIDSPLAEMSVLGFEYGYSLAEPHALVLWEAQFGDFVNGAQIIIDQFITSGESKWLRMSGLVMLLPHGYEGQGPEHSSARPERFLMACAEDNMQVVNCSTPANFFHALRRQVHRKYRKPLIVLTPKSLLRHKMCVSDIDAFGPGESFHRVLMDGSGIGPDKGIKRVVICSGKVYYDLLEERDKRKLNDEICLLRLEQFYPFPKRSMADDLSRFPQAEVVWCQEESKNMGAWFFVEPYLEAVMADLDMAHKRPRYVGREASAAPATGIGARHVRQQQALIDEALTLSTPAKVGSAKSRSVKARKKK